MQNTAYSGTDFIPFSKPKFFEKTWFYVNFKDKIAFFNRYKMEKFAFLDINQQPQIRNVLIALSGAYLLLYLLI